MTSAWFVGARSAVPQNENDARSTVEPVRTDSENAEQTAPPDWNERESDESGQLVGLSPRVAGSDTIPSVQTAPPLPETATANHNALIDNQVATAGTAAQREMAGERGHGSMQYAIGIEPLNPAQRYGNEFFVRGALGANEGGGDYMTPPVGDNWGNAVAQSVATQRSRTAYQDSLFKNFMAGA